MVSLNFLAHPSAPGVALAACNSLANTIYAGIRPCNSVSRWRSLPVWTSEGRKRNTRKRDRDRVLRRRRRNRGAMLVKERFVLFLSSFIDYAPLPPFFSFSINRSFEPSHSVFDFSFFYALLINDRGFIFFPFVIR